MKNCPWCASEVSEDNQVFVAQQIENANLSWYQAENDDLRYGMPIGRKLDIGNGLTAEVVAKKVAAVATEFETGYYDGGTTLPQGTEFKTFVVLKVGENFFKKEGTGDSYSDITWDGPVRPVKPSTKQITVYEF